MLSVKGSVPLPTTLPSMATLELLTNNLELYSDELFKQLEEINLEVYQKVLAGFKDTGRVCKTFIHEMGALAITFFTKAEGMEANLATTDAIAFAEAMVASKTHIICLIQEVAEAEDIYNAGEATFNDMLASVSEEIKKYIQEQGTTQHATYKKKCLDRVSQDHGRLDGTCFVPMIVGNLTAHRALAMSQRVVQSQVPLQIMMVPLRTQAGAIKVYTKFIEFLARRVVALQEKLGPGISTVNLESEATDQAAPAGRGCSCSTTPPRKHQPTRADPESPLWRSSPMRSTPKKTTPEPPAKNVFSPHSRSILDMWEKLGSDDDDQPDQKKKDKLHKCQSGIHDESLAR